jgi:Pyridoxamine 5'-phosphate oxidase
VVGSPSTKMNTPMPINRIRRCGLATTSLLAGLRTQKDYGRPGGAAGSVAAVKEPDMPEHSDLALLQDPVAQELLLSPQLARLAYTWTDGTPRVVPIWFHWDGRVVTLGTPVRAPKLRALASNPNVSLTIDDSTSWPYKALLLRGQASVEMLDDVSPEYAASARRYFGETQGDAWVSQLRGQPMARISIEPTWVRVLDFVTRFPSALSA